MVLSPVMLSVNGPPAFRGLSRTSQRPSLAVVLTVWSWNLTVTCSPSLAVPQTGTATPCCSTAPSENRLLGFTSARATGLSPASTAAMEIATKARLNAGSLISIFELMRNRRTGPTENAGPVRNAARLHQASGSNRSADLRVCRIAGFHNLRAGAGLPEYAFSPQPCRREVGDPGSRRSAQQATRTRAVSCG